MATHEVPTTTHLGPLGDFNEMCAPGEVVGGDFSDARAQRMLGTVEECELIDLGFTGPKFTWQQCVNGRRTTTTRLDRALGDISWRHLFQEAYVEHCARCIQIIALSSCDAR